MIRSVTNFWRTTNFFFWNESLLPVLLLVSLISPLQAQVTFPGICPERSIPSRKYSMSRFAGKYFEVMSNINQVQLKCTSVKIGPFAEGRAQVDVYTQLKGVPLVMSLTGNITIDRDTRFTGNAHVRLQQLGAFNPQVLITDLGYNLMIARICKNNENDDTYTEKIFVMSRFKDLKNAERADIFDKLKLLGLENANVRETPHDECTVKKQQ